MSEDVRTETHGPVLVVTIDRPQARNAVDRPTADLLAAAFRAFDADDCAGRGRAHRRRRHLLRRRRPQGHRRGAGQPGRRRHGRRRTDGPDPHAARQAGDRRGRGLRGGRRARAGGVVRSAGGGVRRGLRGVLPAVGRPARRRGHDPPAPAHRPEPRQRPDPDRPRCVGGRGRRHGPGEPVASRPAPPSPRRSSWPPRSPSLPQVCLRNDRRSSYDQWGLDEPDALRRETELALETLASPETIEGVTRFTSGAGRHGM